jgi:hypothetical protein
MCSLYRVLKFWPVWPMYFSWQLPETVYRVLSQEFQKMAEATGINYIPRLVCGVLYRQARKPSRPYAPALLFLWITILLSSLIYCNSKTYSQLKK